MLLLKYNGFMDQNNGGVAPQQTQNPGPMMPPVNPGMPVQPVPNLSAPMAQPNERKGSLAETIILVIVCLIAAGAIVFAVVQLMQYNELKTNFDMKVTSEVVKAQKEQIDTDEAKFEEREKTPNREFTGPSDYGSISFQYPKTWNFYEHSDGSKNSDYKAYFAPDRVRPVSSSDSRYALRFTILHRQAEDVMTTYNTKVKSGALKSSTFSAGDGGSKVTGTLYQGTIEREITGMVLVLKINDKTAVLQCDSEEFQEDFEALIQTLRKNS